MAVQTEPHVFVSYAADDKDLVLPIVDRLEHSGLAVWVDRRRIMGGMAWAQEIVRAIRRCKALVLMCSDAALRSRAVAQEIQLAWKYRLAYVPVLLQPTTYTDQLEFFLEGSQWIDAYNVPLTDWIPGVVESLRNIGILADNTGSATNATVPTPTLDGLRKVASFTDRIWPLVVDQVNRSADSVEYVARDLGPARENARHEIRLASRVLWAIDWDQDAHLLLLDEGPEGRTYCLCPSWFCPSSRIAPGITLLPPASANAEPFVVTGQPGREHILAILSTKPLADDWMPDSPNTPARVLSSSDIAELTRRIQRLDAGTWAALATYCDVTV
jgi:TIR domain/Domain of unknown function (DUF4384)